MNHLKILGKGFLIIFLTVAAVTGALWVLAYHPAFALLIIIFILSYFVGLLHELS